jgi:hypothetical protein
MFLREELDDIQSDILPVFQTITYLPDISANAVKGGYGAFVEEIDMFHIRFRVLEYF